MLKILSVFLYFFIGLLITLPFAKNTKADNCTSGPNRAEGLVSAESISAGSTFSTSSGACVIDPEAAPFLSFRLPGYEELVSLYFNQNRQPASVVTKHPPLSGDLHQDSIPFGGTTDHLYKINGNLTITGNNDGPNTGVVFVDGNLFFAGNYYYGSASLTGPVSGTVGAVFVVQGNVYIEPTVTRIDAVIISSGKIYTASSSTSPCGPNSVQSYGANSSLTVNGSLVALDETNNIQFCRKVSGLAGETINQQPKYLVILRNLYSDTLQRWSEIIGDVELPNAPPNPFIPLPGPNPTIVAFWSFDERTNGTCSGGKDACDASVNSNNGKANGTTINTTSKLLGAAARDFNGSGDNISVNDNASLHLTPPFTIEAWVKRNTTGVEHAIISKHLAMGSWKSFTFQITQQDKLMLSIQNNLVNPPNGQYPNWVSNVSVPVDVRTPNTWTHVAAIVSGITGTSADAKLYINGQEVSSTFTANNYTSGFVYGYSGDPVIIGAKADDNGTQITPTSYYNGTIDEVKIYKTDRPETVLQDYQAGIHSGNPTIIDTFIQIFDTWTI